MNFGSKILQYQENIIKDLAELISIPSVRGEASKEMPFGQNSAKALNRILEMADHMGLTTKTSTAMRDMRNTVRAAKLQQ